MILYQIQQILVPVDLSDTSLNALHTGVALAKKHRAGLHLLFVNEITPNYESTSDSLISRQVNMDVLLALAGSIKQRDGLLPEVIEQEGSVAESVIKVAANLQADLIVMGTHGASGYRDGFIGSNTYSVMKYATCPVLSIPPKRKFSSFKKVLFPIKPLSGALLPYDVASLFLSSSSTVNVLGLSYLNIRRETAVLDRIVEEIRDKWENQKVDIQTAWSMGNSVATDILQFAQENNPELIVLTSVMDAIPKPNFIGPNTQKVINGARVPVLHIKKTGVYALNTVA